MAQLAVFVPTAMPIRPPEKVEKTPPPDSPICVAWSPKMRPFSSGFDLRILPCLLLHGPSQSCTDEGQHNGRGHQL